MLWLGLYDLAYANLGGHMLEELYADAKEKSSLEVNNCVVGLWRHSLEEKDKKIFDISLEDTDFSTRRLYELYKNAGCTFGLTTLNEHRNGRCGCR